MITGTKSQPPTSIGVEENEMNYNPQHHNTQSALGTTDAPAMDIDQPVGGMASDPESPTGWMGEGNCRLYPPSTFFPSDGVGVDRARKICKGCPVLDACLEYALTERIEHGVWGGCSERERRRILKQRRLEAAVVGD